MNSTRFAHKTSSMTAVFSSIAFPCKLLLFFLLDVVAFGLLGWQMMQALLCLYIVQVLACATELRLICLGALLLCESFMLYDALFVPLVYLAPVLLFGVCARYMLYPGVVQRLCIVSLVLLVQSLIEIWLLGLICPMRYILYRLCVNLVLILFV